MTGQVSRAREAVKRRRGLQMAPLRWRLTSVALGDRVKLQQRDRGSMHQRRCGNAFDCRPIQVSLAAFLIRHGAECAESRTYRFSSVLVVEMIIDLLVQEAVVVEL